MLINIHHHLHGELNAVFGSMLSPSLLGLSVPSRTAFQAETGKYSNKTRLPTIITICHKMETQSHDKERGSLAPLDRDWETEQGENEM